MQHVRVDTDRRSISEGNLCYGMYLRRLHVVNCFTIIICPYLMVHNSNKKVLTHMSAHNWLYGGCMPAIEVIL